MKKGLLALFTTLLLIAMCSAVFADQLTAPSAAFNQFILQDITLPLAKEGGVMLLPDGRNITNGELDNTWDDSIYYYVPNQYSLLWPGSDYWSAARFTPTADFTLQGIRFCALNQYGNDADNVEVYVYTDDDGEPGEALNDGDPVYDELIPQYDFENAANNWNEIDFEDQEVAEIEFLEGEDFWILYGPAPGGAYADPNGWWNLMDATLANGDRSIWSVDLGNNADWTDCGGDLLITAEGQLATFIDLGVRSVYNDIDKFFFAPNTEVQLTASVKNYGNTESPAVEVEFIIIDADGNEIYSESADLDAIDGGDSTEVDAPDTWTPDEAGYFVITATLAGDNMEEDPNADNDEESLIQGIVATSDEYKYDDGEFESAINYVNRGPGVGFKPLSYPAQLDSAKFYIGYEDGLDDVLFIVAHVIMDTDTSFTTFNLLWTGRENTVFEWNSFALEDDNGDPLEIDEGLFVLAFIGEGDSYLRDNNPPSAAANPDMHRVAFDLQVDGEQVSIWYSETGNWATRADISTIVPPEIFFTEDTLDFGEVLAGESGFVDISIVNNGLGIAVIDSIFISPLISDVVAVVDELPVEIEGGGEGTVTLEWVPADGDDHLVNGAMFVYHNDPQTNGQQIIIVNGTATGEYVEEAGSIPNEYFLSQNFPNPFNPTTDISFGLKNAGHVSLTVYNVMGQEIASLVDQPLTAGFHKASFDGASMASGVYYYSIEVNDFRSLKKMVLLK